MKLEIKLKYIVIFDRGAGTVLRAEYKHSLFITACPGKFPSTSWAGFHLIMNSFHIVFSREMFT